MAAEYSWHNFSGKCIDQWSLWIRAGQRSDNTLELYLTDTWFESLSKHRLSLLRFPWFSRQLPFKSFPIHQSRYYLTLHSVEVLSGAVATTAFCTRDCSVLPRMSLQQCPSDVTCVPLETPGVHLSQKSFCRALFSFTTSWAEKILTESFRVFLRYLQADAYTTTSTHTRSNMLSFYHSTHVLKLLTVLQ